MAESEDRAPIMESGPCIGVSPGSRGAPHAARPTSAAPAAPQDMVRCPVCAVHLPRADAVADPQGRLYCSPEHRQSARP